MPLQDLAHERLFVGIFRGNAEFLPGVRQGIGHTEVFLQRQTDFMAFRLGDPALRLHFLPGDVHLLGTDEGKNVVLPAVLPDQRCRQPETPPRLNGSRNLKNRRGQEMYLVVDNQTPAPGIEEGEMWEIIPLPGPVGHDLVSGKGDRADILDRTAVFADIVLCQGGLVEKLGRPLADGRHACGEDQGGGLDLGHAGHSHDGLAGAAGQDDDAGAPPFRTAGMENLRR